MAAILILPKIQTLGDLQHHLGGIPVSRIRMKPTPGTASEADVLNVFRTEHRLCELIDGTLVEKALGFKASWLAGVLFSYLFDFVNPRNLGLMTTADGMMQLTTGLFRIPDVSFIAWDRIPGGKVPSAPIPKLAPNLAVEVLSESNTPAEMKRKRREYFKAGVKLLWIVDPAARTVDVFTSATAVVTLGESDTLDGGDVLPGFTLSLRELFAVLDRTAAD